MQYTLCIVGMAKMTEKVGQQWILDFRWIWKESAISKVEFSHALHFLLSSEYHRIVIFCWFNEKYVFSSHCLLLKCCSEPQVKVRSGIFPLQNSEIVPHPVTAVYNATKMIPSNDWTSRLIWPSQITGEVMHHSSVLSVTTVEARNDTHGVDMWNMALWDLIMQQ